MEFPSFRSEWNVKLPLSDSESGGHSRSFFPFGDFAGFEGYCSSTAATLIDQGAVSF
jgi:hypothetical protein